MKNKLLLFAAIVISIMAIMLSTFDFAEPELGISTAFVVWSGYFWLVTANSECNQLT